MRDHFLRAAALAVLIGSSGCAAVFKGTHQDVRFDSDPAGAKVENNGRYIGDTPTTGSVDRLGPMNIRVSRPGYADSSGTLARRPDAPWLVFDVITCVIPVLLCIPVLVDGLSGAWMSIDDEYRVKLDRAAPAAVPPSVESRPAAPPPAASGAAFPM